MTRGPVSILCICGTFMLVACDARNSPGPAAPTITTIVATAAAPAGLFSDDPGTGTTSGPRVIRRRDANVDVAQLQLGGVQPAKGLRLNLFRDTDFNAEFERLESTPIGSAWVGSLDGVAGGRVTLAVSVDGVFSGTVEFPGTLYSVVRAATGRYAIAQVDLTSIPRPG